MSDLAIGRLILELPGVDEAYARDVAQGLAEGLAASGCEGRLSPAPVCLQPRPGENAQALAGRVLAVLLQRIG
jgi:hypothetical protein